VIARELGNPNAPGTIAEIEKVLSPQQRTEAGELAQTIRAALKPVQAALILQRADAAPASPPWATAPAPKTVAAPPAAATKPAASPPVVTTPAPTTPAPTTPAPSTAPAQPKQATAPQSAPALLPPVSLPGAIHKVEMPFVMVIGDAFSITAARAIDVDAGPFKSSAERDKLFAALAAYRSGRYAVMKQALADADTAEANVLFMRGLADLAIGTVQSWHDAGSALRSAAGKGQVQAKVLLASLQLLGQAGVALDIDSGRRVLEATANNPHALRALAAAHLNGTFGSKDVNTGAALMRRSADAGDPLAMLYFARLSHEGVGVQKNVPLAEQYLRKSAGIGLSLAQRVLGNWILAQYRDKVTNDPSDGLGILIRAAFDVPDAPPVTKLDPLLDQITANLPAIRARTSGQTLWPDAVADVALFLMDTGRDAPWKDDAKAAKILRTCIDVAFLRCHFAYATMLEYGRGGLARDPVAAHAHYSVVSANAKAAVERMDGLAKTMTPEQISAARALANKLQSGLRPVPAPPMFRAAK
jgi:TPR repeat protein